MKNDVGGDMNVYVINMDRDRDRMLAVDSQLKRLGVVYSRFSAIDAKTLEQSDIKDSVNRFRWSCAVGRPVRIGEIGCAMSHYSIYRQISEPVCILEDDVILDNRFPAVLKKVEKWINPKRSQVVLLSNHTREKMTSAGVFAAKSDMYTEGYVITPAAAKALIRVNWPLMRPCDHWGSWAQRGVIELYHAFPTVCSQNQTQYSSNTAGGNVFRVADLSVTKYIFHKAKRLMGKTLDNLLPLYVK